MKTIHRLLLTILLIAAAIAPATAKPIFQDLPKSSDISYVFVSKTAMRLGMSSAYLNSSKDDIISCISNPEGLEVISADGKENRDRIADYINNKIKSLDFELILSSEEDSEVSSIYAQEIKDGTIAKGILIINSDSDEINVVYFCGDIDIKCLSEN